ncbi:CRISPR-associated endonuclease Cas1 [Frankia sp. AvcI1]|uniref:CRISPR-associated endonuclease Cas1 n=1 Tax=Frankia sp. AvcI1 TaxID=573496 RepID=UPI002117EFD0|nr:CRISPR-associated endonuclease Cas1 [Frankia sp. AvcI1]
MTETLPDPTHDSAQDVHGVAVCDGHGLSMKVVRGHLEISDRWNGEPRIRRYPRAGHGLRRIMIIGESGTVTLSAMHWCSDLGIPVIVIHPDGRILSTSTYTQTGLAANDGRLRKAQALAADTKTGLAVCHTLLAEKLELSADVVDQYLTDDDGSVSSSLRRAGRAEIRMARTPERCREMEGEAAALYFGAWSDVDIRFCKTDRGSVPDHWHRFDSRNSRATTRRTAKKASNPINAMLNYLYTIAATECRLSCFAMGLDPTMGYLHNDAANRDSLVWDLMETVRPVVDGWLLMLLAEHTFTRHDFSESRTGSCYVEAPLTHTLAATAPLWARAVAPHTEAVTHIIAKSSPYPIRCTTPLTATRMRTAQGKREYRTVDPYGFRQALPAPHEHCHAA